MTILAHRTDHIFDYAKASEAVDKIIAQYPDLLQIGLTHSTNDLTEHEKVIECTGSMFDFEARKYKRHETEFTVFNDAFKDTYIYEMYNALRDIGRVRIMIMDGPKCYTVHRDLTKRYHYVIRTNADCFFVFPESAQHVHVPCDHGLYILDTTHRHTFVNGSRSRRVHLVFDDISTLK